MLRRLRFGQLGQGLIRPALVEIEQLARNVVVVARVEHAQSRRRGSHERDAPIVKRIGVQKTLRPGPHAELFFDRGTVEDLQVEVGGVGIDSVTGVEAV